MTDDSSQLLAALMDTSIYDIVNDGNPDLRQDLNFTDADYDVNIQDDKMSLSQYYSQFADDMPDLISGSIDFNDIVMPQPLENTIIDYNLFNNTEVDKPAVKKPKIWKCARNCGKIFTQEKYMRNHIMVMHEKTSSIQCKICSLYLSTKARLKNHMIRHSGVDRFVCLICVNKKANDKSCMRHHLSEKHGINSKHSLFHESYYEMSLKEMSLVKKSKGAEFSSGGGGSDDGDDDQQDYSKHTSICKKSANDIDELKQKILDKSKRVKKLLKLMNGSGDDKGDEAETDKTDGDPTACVNNVFQISIPEPRKIVTAENGMKLMKLPNGQFTKIASN